MSAPDEAVEAAAQILYVVEHGPWISGGGIAAGGTPWGTSREARERDRYQVRARAALEAAAPYIAAQTLREASAAYPLETAYGGAEHAVNWLADRAEHIEAVPAGAASVIQGENP